MHPELLTVGPLTISSFGASLTSAFFLSIFLSWRIARAYDISEEKILDMAILSLLGGLIGARILFLIFHWSAFESLDKAIFINRYPGLSFWGGLFGVIVTLRIFTSRFKLNFWQIADFAAVAGLLGLVLGDVGCFLGGCAIGQPSNLPWAVQVVGVVGKRLPVSLIESVVLLIVLIRLWKQVTRFHFSGKIAALFFILVGIIKFVTEFFRGDNLLIRENYWFSYGHLFATLLFAGGMIIFYRQSKRRIWSDIEAVISIIYSKKNRDAMISSLGKSCYNQKVVWGIRANQTMENIKQLPKNLRKRLHVKPNPTNFN